MEILEKRQAIGQFLGGGRSLFLFDLSPAEHIDFCAQGQMCISHMGGEEGGAGQLIGSGGKKMSSSGQKGPSTASRAPI